METYCKPMVNDIDINRKAKLERWLLHCSVSRRGRVDDCCRCCPGQVRGSGAGGHRCCAAPVWRWRTHTTHAHTHIRRFTFTVHNIPSTAHQQCHSPAHPLEPSPPSSIRPASTTSTTFAAPWKHLNNTSQSTSKTVPAPPGPQ